MTVTTGLTPATTVLVLTERDEVRAQAERSARSAGVNVAVTGLSRDLALSWQRATAVVVDAELRHDVNAARLPRRAAVQAVDTEPPDAEIWQWATQLGACDVLTLPEGDAGLAAWLAETVPAAAHRACVVGVIAGCGGAGASTFAAALAAVSATDMVTGLVDADPLGCRLDVLLGVETAPGLRWAELVAATDRVGDAHLLAGLVPAQGVRLLSHGPPSDAELSTQLARSVMHTLRAGCDRLVVDLARRVDEASAPFLTALDALVIIVPARIPAVAATMRLLRDLEQLTAPKLLVVRDPCRALSAADIAGCLDLPVGVTVNTDPRVQAAGLHGEVPVGGRRTTLGSAALALWTAVEGMRAS